MLPVERRSSIFRILEAIACPVFLLLRCDIENKADRASDADAVGDYTPAATLCK
jgi:hypothetical protein